MRCEVCEVDFANEAEQAAHWRDFHNGRAKELNAARAKRKLAARRKSQLPARRPELAVVHAAPSGPFTRNRETVRINPSLLPIDYINELERLRDRFMDVLLDLPPAEVWHIVGEIAILANLADRAEETSAASRRERERVQAAALRELAVARNHIADRVEQEPYVPPAIASTRHWPRQLGAGK